MSISVSSLCWPFHSSLLGTDLARHTVPFPDVFRRKKNSSGHKLSRTTRNRVEDETRVVHGVLNRESCSGDDSTGRRHTQ